MRIEWFHIWIILNPLHPRIMLWLKLAQWFWRRFFNFVNVFSLFHNYLRLEKGVALPLNKLEQTYPRMLYAKFGWNWPSGSGEEDENVKSLQTDWRSDRQTDGRTDDDGRRAIRKAHMGFTFTWVKNERTCILHEFDWTLVTHLYSVHRIRSVWKNLLLK